MPNERNETNGQDASPSMVKLKPPVVVLVEPQMGENIGMVARAMGNFGWKRLRLVRPRDGWPNARANATASLATHVIDAAELFDSLEEALADVSLVYATSARKHDLAKGVVGPRQAAKGACHQVKDDQQPTAQGRAAYVFGREAWGLTNDEVALCDHILTLPVDPECASLNLSQAVLICAYEWRRAAFDAFGAADEAATLPVSYEERAPRASKGLMQGMFDHLEGLLDASGFFHPPEKRDRMVRNLRSIFQRSEMNEQEVRTMRGVFSSLDRAHMRSREKSGKSSSKSVEKDEDRKDVQG